MIKEIKRWVAHLEATVNELAKTYNKPVEEVEEAREQFWYDGGDCYDMGAWELEAVDAFKESYELQMEDEDDGDFEE